MYQSSTIRDPTGNETLWTKVLNMILIPIDTIEPFWTKRTMDIRMTFGQMNLK